jgi:hypothetical protein
MQYFIIDSVLLLHCLRPTNKQKTNLSRKKPELVKLSMAWHGIKIYYYESNACSFKVLIKPSYFISHYAIEKTTLRTFSSFFAFLVLLFPAPAISSRTLFAKTLTDSASELSSVSLSSSAEEKRLAPDFLVEDAPDLSFVLGGSPLLPGVPPPAYINNIIFSKC